ncbi:phosphodiesterase [Diaminobutyricimonas aerilata]|nr:phosphodiesterase [Diaminobutyricimonas aerilata]
MATKARWGQHPAADLVIAHISDTHLLTGGVPLNGSIDTVANLHLAMERLAGSGIDFDALVFTGDLTDLGEPGAYDILRDAVEPVAARLGAEVIWVMGNHDERAPFAAALYGESVENAGENAARPQDRVHDVHGLRIIALDSTVPGYHHGELTDAQLDWLRRELAAPAPRGTLLALHHPPVPSPIDFHDALELRDQHKLAEVVEGTDVRGILGGHLHYSTHSTFAGVPVSVAAATCYTMTFLEPDRLLSGVDGGQSIDLVHVYDDRIVHTVAPLARFPEVASRPADLIDRISKLDPELRLELLSSKESTFDRLLRALDDAGA